MQDRNEKENYFLLYFLFFAPIFFLGLYLFYLEATQQITSDLSQHLELINPIISGRAKLPHEGFAYTVYVFAKLLKSNYITAGTIALSLVLVIIASIKFILVKRLAGISVKPALICSIALMFVSAICLPMFNPNFYIGQGSPTVWHNPTILFTKPFAFICVYLTIVTLESFNYKRLLILSILLLISFFYKPSFGIVFIPALGLYIFFKHTKNYRVYLYSFLTILPSLLFLFIYQYRHWFSQTYNSIIISPFGVLHVYTPNVFISFILATAFPLFLLITHPRRVFSNRYLNLSWLMLGVGYLQFAFLAETHCFNCANFSWGFLIALDLVFVFSLIEFIKLIKEVRLPPKMPAILATSFLILIFLSHLISGVAYLGRYMVTGSFM